jgi:hypothetical protein
MNVGCLILILSRTTNIACWRRDGSILVSFISCVFLVFPSLATAQNDNNISTVSEQAFWHAIREREDSVRSFEWRWVQQNQDMASTSDKGPPAGHISPANAKLASQRSELTNWERKWRIVVDGDKVRMEDVGDPGPYCGVPINEHSLTRVFDGNCTRTYSPPSGQQYPIGTIEADSRTGFFEHVSTHAIVLCYRFHAWLSWRKSRKMNDGPMIFGTERLDGKECVVLGWRSGVQASVQTKVWFDPARNFVPIREQTKLRQNIVQFDIEYTRDGTHNFVPTTYTCSTWGAPMKLLSSEQMKVTDWAINPSVEAKTFDLVFPAGTYVFDRNHKIEYILRENGSQRQVSDQEWNRGATYESLLNSEPSDNLDVGSRWSKTRRYSFFSSLTLLAVLVTILAVRQRRRYLRTA